MYQIYQLGPNESIEVVAKKLGIPTDELRRINGIGESASMIAGSYIIVPNMNNMTSVDNMTEITDTSDYTKYVVQKGDNMYNIAKENKTDLNTLFSLNGLNKTDYIYPNQEILIPNKQTYITKENDTIKDIINNLNIDTEKIKDLLLVPDQVIMY